MAEKAGDLGHVLAGLRRHRRAMFVAAVIGAALGMGAVYLWPPMYASSSLVLLPPKAADPNQMAEQVKTDIRIATSDAVLGPASRGLRPRMSKEDLAGQVEVTAATPLVLEIRGRAAEPERAEAISGAVADANVTYVMESLSATSSARGASRTARENELETALEEISDQVAATTARLEGAGPPGPQSQADATALAKLTAEQGRIVLQLDQLQSQTEVAQPGGGASVIQEPSRARRAGLVGRYVGALLVGALVAALLTAVAVTLRTRRDPRLYFRDDIADAVGSPVIASVRTRPMGSVAEWISLIRDYSPGSVDAWAWRRALRQLTLTEPPAAAESRSRGRARHPRSVTVVTLSADLRGLATGPQLAAYAASAGIRTHLVAAQRHETAAALWAGCSSLEKQPDARPGLSVGTRRHDEPPADLTVVLAVLDRHEPKPLDIPPGSVVVLALSAGTASAQELARAAVTIDEAGERVHGVVVADPDDLDRTTGRLLQHDRMHQVPLPTRLTGTPAPRPPRDATSSTEGRPG